MDIEIRALYSESIVDRGVAILISLLGTAEPVDCFSKSVFDRYIRVYRSFGFLLAGYSQLLARPNTPEMRHSTDLQDF